MRDQEKGTGGKRGQGENEGKSGRGGKGEMEKKDNHTQTEEGKGVGGEEGRAISRKGLVRGKRERERGEVIKLEPDSDTY